MGHSRLRTVIAASSALALTTQGCFSSGGGSRPPSTQAVAAQETFAYQPAADRNLRVVVTRVVLRGDPEFIPSDANWLQLHVTVSNIGSRTATLTSVQERLTDGTVLAAATNGSELARPPRIARAAARSVGIGAAGHIVGQMLFPPAAIIGAILSGRSLFRSGNRQANATARFNATGLRAGSIPPGASVSGFVFVPAVSGQSGLVVNYAVGGAETSLMVSRLLPR